jgi:hypothetical protein
VDLRAIRRQRGLDDRGHGPLIRLGIELTGDRYRNGEKKDPNPAVMPLHRLTSHTARLGFVAWTFARNPKLAISAKISKLQE